MLHVLLTPPEADGTTTLDNLGVLEVGCIPPWFQSLIPRLAQGGWIVTLVTNPQPDVFGPQHPARVRGTDYLERIMSHEGAT